MSETTVTSLGSGALAREYVSPWALLAIAELDALHTAWNHLAAARVRVARQALVVDDGLKAWRPNPQQVSGSGSGSGESRSAAGSELDYLIGLEARASEAVDQCRWLVLDALKTLPPDWDATRTLFARLRPPEARSCIAWLTPADTAIRRALYLPDDERPVPGNPDCPVCTVRLIRVRPASGLIVCTAGCRCAGEACVCGMLVKERGAPHIWTSEGTPWTT